MYVNQQCIDEWPANAMYQIYGTIDIHSNGIITLKFLTFFLYKANIIAQIIVIPINIYFAIGIKIICLVLGALGIANMWAAIFADVGVMVIAVLNAIRALNAGK